VYLSVSGTRAVVGVLSALEPDRSAVGAVFMMASDPSAVEDS